MGVGCSQCRWVRDRLPLLAGGELTGTERRTVERHLITCAACRDHRRSLSDALVVLQQAAAVGIDVVGDASDAEPPSLWLALERQIQESRRTPRPGRWDEWREALALPLASPRFRSAALIAAALFTAGGTAAHWGSLGPTPDQHFPRRDRDRGATAGDRPRRQCRRAGGRVACSGGDRRDQRAPARRSAVPSRPARRLRFRSRHADGRHRRPEGVLLNRRRPAVDSHSPRRPAPEPIGAGVSSSYSDLCQSMI